MTQTTPIDVKVRMTRDLHRKIQRSADRHGQTINGEIITRLTQSFEADRHLDLAEKNLAQANDIFEKTSAQVSDAQKFLRVVAEWLSNQSGLAPDVIKRAIEREAQKHKAESDMQAAARRTEETVRLIEERGEKRKPQLPQVNKTEQSHD